jgi:hypothetical protein
MARLRLLVFLKTGFLLFAGSVQAVTKTSTGSGSWGTSTLWTPAGVPAAGDHVIIAAGHTVNVNSNFSITDVTVNAGGTLTFTSGRTLTMSGHLTVNGTVTMNGGNITFAAGRNFIIGAGGRFTWDPGNNSASGATLFTNGIENFSPTSTLIIKRWYNYSVPIGSVVSSHFGNLELNSFNNPFIIEWNQNNWFQTRQVLGELAVDVGWIVLDKSSSITATTIGSIHLKNTNSYLDLHGGTHNSTFKVTTDSIIIQGGMLNGIYNGNGSIIIEVNNKVVINAGSFFGIYNSGVSGVGNGNFTLEINGNFEQTGGDFRGIYNLSSYNGGISQITVNNLNFSGGIWIGQYACHTGGLTCKLKVHGNLNINFSSASDIFRGVGLSLLSSTYNNPQFDLSVDGNLVLSGAAAAEWISSAASGAESALIAGTTSISGGTNRFNYGAAGIDHPTNLTFGNTVTVNGGTTFLSALGNSSTALLQQHLTLSNGTLTLKGGNGAMNVTVNGDFTQTAGTLFLYNNTSAHSTQTVTLTINGNFTHSGGTLNFNNNTSSASASHTLIINGSNYSISGSGSMTHASAGTGSVFGLLNFNRNGIITFSRTGTHSIQQIRQTVKSGCTLDVSTGNIQIASHSSSSHQNLFRIEGSATVNLFTNQMVSNTLQSNSSVYVENNGMLILARVQGLYDGTANGAISATGGMTYYLEPNSIVEYNGNDNQAITGIGSGTATGNMQKYGILRINFAGTPDAEYVYLTGNNVYVRTQLNLVQGELNLNNYKLTIESGSPSAMVRTSGYLKSETNAAINNGIVRWENMSNGTYHFMFGVNSTTYIPVIFSSSTNGFMEVSTRRTTMTNNTPWTGLSHVAPVTNMNQNGVDVSVPNVIDRWWVIYAPGMSGSLTLSYVGSENTTDPTLRTGLFSIQAWNGLQWLPPAGSGNGITSGVGTVTANSFSQFFPIVLVSQPSPLPVQWLFFKASRLSYLVELEWATASEKNNSHFLVERSVDGKNFEILGRVNGAGNSTAMHQYRFTDDQPLRGTSYYRIRQVDFDGQHSFSKIEILKFEEGIAANEIEVNLIEPNPFNDYLNATFTLPADGETLIRIVDGKGKAVYQKTEFLNAGVNQFSFENGNRIKSGIYFLLINQGHYRASKRIVKQ